MYIVSHNNSTHIQGAFPMHQPTFKVYLSDVKGCSRALDSSSAQCNLSSSLSCSARRTRDSSMGPTCSARHSSSWWNEKLWLVDPSVHVWHVYCLASG